VARIEGGKLRGRANRPVPLLPVAVAWLRAAGSPDHVRPLTRVAREKLCELASVTWKHDICRHTFISHHLEMLKNNGEVAREAGTSEDIILRRWLALRPSKNATPAKAEIARDSGGAGGKRRPLAQSAEDAALDEAA